MDDCIRTFEKFVEDSKLPVGTEENHDSSWSGWSA